MSAELRELTALAALGALDAEDGDRLAGALALDAALAAELAHDRETVTLLEDLVRPVAAPAHLGERIVTAALAEERPARSLTRGIRRLAPTLGAAAVAAAIAVVLTLLIGRGGGGLGTPSATAAIARHTSPTPISGTAALYAPATAGGRMVLDLHGVAPAPAGRHYQVWVLRTGATTMEAVGAFAAGGDVTLELGLPGAGDYGAVDISLQEDAGPQEHSATSIAGGTFAPGG